MRKRFLKWLAGFVTDHITWEFLLWLLANQWAAGLSLTGALVLAVAVWFRKQPPYVSALGVAVLLVLAALAFVTTLSLRQKGIAEIRFDYLPERSPEQNGWELFMDQGNTRPTYSLAGDCPENEKGLYVRGWGYRLDYRLELHESLCKFVYYSAKLTDTSIIYANVRMASKDGARNKDGWIAYRFEAAATPTKERDNEWILKAEGRPLNQTGWRSFRWPLAVDMARTFGTEGWVYKRLLRIRLRGTLSISPIRLLE